MNEFQFKPEIAELYGVDEAIFLHSLSFWLTKNWSNGHNFHDGHYWSYDTCKDIAKRFPFWTVRQIERIIASCKEQGAILAGNFNEDKTKRTKWYTMTGEAEAIYFPKTVECIPPDGEMPAPQWAEGDGEDVPPAPSEGEQQDIEPINPLMVECIPPFGGLPAPEAVGAHMEEAAPIPPNGEMQPTEPWDPFHQTVDCIKETVTNQVNNTPLPPKGGQRRKAGLSEGTRAMLNEYVAGDQELTEAMVALMELRDLSHRAKNTDRAVKMLLTELERLSGGDRGAKLEIVRRSVLNGWVGVFPLKGGRASPQDGRRREEVPTW